MSNFRFKQFVINQDRCAMKVCTDACLFGSWLAQKLESNELIPGNILDIGTGTGLLSLMLAQNTNAAIDAIEIDSAAAEQASENVAGSPWADQIIIHNVALQHFSRAIKYDLIISNPPFFEGQLKSPDNLRNLAMHSATLDLKTLMAGIDTHLANNGTAAILLPHDRLEEIGEIASSHNFYIREIMNVADRPGKQFTRSYILLSKVFAGIKESTLFIKTIERQYSSAFQALLKDYYLHF